MPKSHASPSLGIYLAVFAGLLALTALTAWLSTLDLGPFGLPTALAIAMGKGSLVAHFFMHLRGSTGITKAYAYAGIVMLVLLMGLTIGDALTRG